MTLFDDWDALRRQVVQAAEATQRAFAPLEELGAQLQRSVAPFIGHWDQFAQDTAQLNRLVDETVVGFEPTLRQWQEQFAPAVADFWRIYNELPERQRWALEVLARDGWYLDPAMPIHDVFEAADLLEEGKTEEVRESFCQHFESRLSEIEADLNGRFPRRARILSAALRAHLAGEYALAVPVFLAQADGICFDLMGVQLYARRQGLPSLAAHLRIGEQTAFRAASLYPLTNPMPISAGPKEREGLSERLLNRHTVVHGEELDYDTRVNSSRALSLLVYVSWILKPDPD